MNCIDCNEPVSSKAGLMVFTGKECRVMCAGCAASYATRQAAFLRLWSDIPGALGDKPPLDDAGPNPALSNTNPSGT